jgi:hypothetical protein
MSEYEVPITSMASVSSVFTAMDLSLSKGHLKGPGEAAFAVGMCIYAAPPSLVILL